jgi:hypothetical protein
MAPHEVRIEAAPYAFPAHVRELYPHQDPRLFVARFGPAQSLLLVGAFRAERHWHYVGVGLRPRISADLSFRLRATVPEQWPVEVLARYADLLARGGTNPSMGHYLRLTDRCAPFSSFALVPDPSLPSCFQVVALDEDELACMREDGWRELITAMRERDPFFVAAAPS